MALQRSLYPERMFEAWNAAMSSKRRPEEPTERRTTGVQPKSPAEALEPTRGPVRPSGPKRRRESRKLNPFLRAVNSFLTLTTVAFALLGVGGYWIATEINKDGPLKETRNFVVPRGEGAHDIAKRLEGDGIIGSQQMFVAHYIGRSLSGWVGGQALQLKAGEYEIPPGSSLRAVSEILGEGRSMLYRVTVPEGLTSTQIVNRLRNDQNLTGDIAAIPAEGTLLPDTYKYSRGMTRQQLIDLMQDGHRKLLERLWAARQPDLPLKSIEDAITLASIIEKETGRNDERDKVAAVFVNRLRLNMRLQSDPTINYGLFQGEVDWGRPIYKSEIQQKTAHNTYQIDGLPPTPICNPGKSTIEATLNPAKTSDLYFVANGRGGHVFTTNLKDHNAAVANWRKAEQDIRARQANAPVKTPAKAAPANTLNAPAPVTPVAEPTVPVVPIATAPPEPPTAATPPLKEAAPVPTQSAPQTTAASAEAVSVPLPVRKPKRP
jgi:UPF0755 protein